MNLDIRVAKAISAVEIAIAALVIIFDLLIPTVVVLAIIALSLFFFKDTISSLGFKKPNKAHRMIIIVLLLALVWTIVQFSITLPLLNHLTGTAQNLSAYENLKGNIVNLLFLLFLTWTIAAFGEEIVYRGFLQHKIRHVVGNSFFAVALAVGISSGLFGLAHSEQGIVGIAVTFVDAVFFSIVKIKFSDNIWASILGHGFNNSIGLVTFFFVGPLYGLW